VRVKSTLHDRLAKAGPRVSAKPSAGNGAKLVCPPPGSCLATNTAMARQNWFDHSADEHRAVRAAVGLFDQSSFAKFRLEGTQATCVLNRVCANDIAVAPGKIVYTQWLNDRGGIEADPHRDAF